MSIKFRFTWLLSLFSLVVVSTFSVFVYLHIEKRMLGRAAQSLSDFVVHEWDHLDHLRQEFESRNEAPPFKEISLRVFAGGERVLDAFPGDFASLEAPYLERTNTYLTKQIERTQDGKNYQLVGLYDLRPTRAYLAALARTLVLGCLIAFILTFPLSYVTGKLLLEPFNYLSRRASELGAEDLGFRFPPPAQLDEHGRLVQSFNSLLERLESAFAQTRRFAVNASHEFRTPVSVIIAQSEMVLRKPREAEEYREAATKVLAQATGLRSLLHHLLSLADIERLQKENKRTQIQVGDLISEVLRSLEHRYSASTSVRLIPEKSTITLQGNEEILVGIATNLIENAIKHSRRAIEVRYEKNENGFELVIEDDGPGIAEENREKVFEPLFRQPGSSKPNLGHGLGLSLVKAYVNAAKGRIELGQSQLGGLSVRVTLPEADT